MENFPTQMAKLQDIIQYNFRNKDLLKRALTTIGYVKEHRLKDSEHHESLRNLGDAVIDVLIYEKVHEIGVTSKGDADYLRQMVCEKTMLKNIGLFLRLELFVRWSRGQYINKDWINGKKLLGECLEALIGAIHLDGGLDSACSTFWLLYSAYNQHSNNI